MAPGQPLTRTKRRGEGLVNLFSSVTERVEQRTILYTEPSQRASILGTEEAIRRLGVALMLARENAGGYQRPQNGSLRGRSG